MSETTMSGTLIFEGKCWKFGHNIPTDEITPTHVFLKSFPDMAKHVLENLNPDFPTQVEPGDIIVAGHNFGCSSGRAVAPKALKATGVGLIIAEKFSRTFYRNGHEIGLPILEVPGIHELVNNGDRIQANLETGLVKNLSSGETINTTPPPDFLLEMLRVGGLISFLKNNAETFLSQGDNY